MRTRYLLVAVALLALVLCISNLGEAHNVSVAFPNEVVVDIGDAMRWLTLNTNANIPNPQTTIQIWVKNLGSIKVSACAKSVTNGTIAKLSCPTTAVGVESGKNGVITCNVDLNAYSGTPLHKTFTGPKHVDTVELNLLVIDGDATDCSTYTTLYNWYTIDVNIVVLDTNDSAWTKVYERDGSTANGVYFGVITAHTVDDVGFPCASDGSLTQASTSNSTLCRSGPCYATYNDWHYPQLFKFAGIDTSGFSECYVVAYFYAGTNRVDGMGIFVENDAPACYGPQNARAFYYQNDNAYPYTWVQMAAPVPTVSDLNVILIIHFDEYQGNTLKSYVDDVRVYCR